MPYGCHRELQDCTLPEVNLHGRQRPLRLLSLLRKILCRARHQSADALRKRTVSQQNHRSLPARIIRRFRSLLGPESVFFRNDGYIAAPRCPEPMDKERCPCFSRNGAMDSSVPRRESLCVHTTQKEIPRELSRLNTRPAEHSARGPFFIHCLSRFPVSFLQSCHRCSKTILRCTEDHIGMISGPTIDEICWDSAAHQG